MWNKIILEKSELKSLIKRYKNGESVSKLSKNLAISPKALNRILRENAIKIRGLKESRILAGKQIRKIQTQEIIKLLESGKSLSRIARENGLHRQTLTIQLKKNGIKPSEISHQSQYSVDETAFDIVTEESAYWIGFLMADGCIQVTPKKNNIVLGLQISDIKHLEKFRKFLKSERAIHIQKDGKMAQFTIGSKRLCQSVMKYGVIPRKCKVTKVIGLEMNRHFWRGVVDGDGCVFTRTCWSLSLNGSESLLNQFSSFVRSHFPEYKATVRKAKGCYVVQSGIKAIDLLYSDCKIALTRKLARAKKAIKISTVLNSAKQKGQ